MELSTHVNYNEVLKYLGYRKGGIDESIDKKIKSMAELVQEKAEPKVCCTILKISSNDPLLFERTEAQFLGEDIKNHLKDSFECVFMAATLGREIDICQRRLSTVDMTDSVIFDSCASSAIESVCNSFSAELEREYEKKGLFITDRFSPGYGDMPIDSQRDVVNILQAEKKIGLYLNRSMMMEPVKSVTALIGIAKTPQEKRKATCEGCVNLKGCGFRERGVRCYE